MKIIVISYPKKVDNEIDIINQLFENGLENFHLRKPNYSKKQIVKFLNLIPYIYRNRIVIHSHYDLCTEYDLKGVHFTSKYYSLKSDIKNFLNNNDKIDFNTIHHKSRSFHNFHNLINCKEKFNYVFLSPVFDSISKKNYNSVFSLKINLKGSLSKVIIPVMALGGVNINNIEEAKEFGFKGVGLLGTIWKNDNPVESFLKIREKCEKLKELDNKENYEPVYIPKNNTRKFNTQ